MRHPYKSLAVALGLALTLSACDDGFTEMNVDPSQASAEDMDLGYLFTATQLRTSGGRYESWRANLIYSSTIVQHLASLQGYWSGDKYLYNASYSSALFDRYYPDVVKPIVDIVDKAQENPADVNLLSAARIWKVVAFHRLTDMYGDVPYFEAGKGFIDGIYTPAYDSQEEIYRDMLKELEEATAAFDPSQPTFGAADLLYAGDIEQWRTFGYSMMLRLGLRLSKVDPGAAQEWVQKAVAGGVMESNEDIAYIQHTDGPGGINRNGNGEVFLADQNMRLAKTFVDWMRDRDDPRLGVYGMLPDGNDDPAVQLGLPNGLDADLFAGEPVNDLDLYSLPHLALQRVDAPMFFQTYAEVEFMLAEAAHRGWISGSAQEHYENGVRAALSYLELYGPDAFIAPEAIDAYLAANPFDAANAFEQINEQYWAATFLNEYEAWANWRRSGYPELVPVNYPGNVTGGTVPRRLRYPGSEAVVNKANYDAVTARQGPDELTTRVWWDAP